VPTNRKRFRRNLVSGAGGKLTAPQLEHLLRGFVFFDEPFKDDQERRECWEKHKTYIMSLQGQAVQAEAFGLSQGIYFDFGKRPQAWWRYDAPGARLYVSCKNDFCPDFPGCVVAQNIRRKMPACVIPRDERDKGSSFDGLYRLECVGHKFKIFLPTIESEDNFLERHNLLNEVEKKALAKMPTQPTENLEVENV
jgi:hypothetical protein